MQLTAVSFSPAVDVEMSQSEPGNSSQRQTHAPGQKQDRALEPLSEGEPERTEKVGSHASGPEEVENTDAATHEMREHLSQVEQMSSTRAPDLAIAFFQSPQEPSITSELLTPEEESERHRLELRVERAFYEAGNALLQLRNQRLYRSTHATFEEYCRERFGFTHRHVNYLISGSQIVENLQMGTISSQILPTSETQVRPLANLEPDQQCLLWQQAVEEAGGKVPSFRIVKGVVERLKERDTIPPAIPYRVGDVLQIVAKIGELRRYDGCWAIATDINEYTLDVCVHDGEVQLKPENLKPIDSPDECHKIRKLAERIAKLRECELDRGAYPILESLGRHANLTPLEEGLLTFLEKWYLDARTSTDSFP